MTAFSTSLALSMALVATGLGQAPKASQKQLDDDVKTLVQANNEFAFDLYRQLCKQEGNIIFSPYSISTALAMTYAGARGETAKQMAKVMHFTLPQERLHPAFGELMRNLHGQGEKQPYRLELANALWPQRELQLVQDFAQLAGRHYGAGLTPVDYIRDTEGSRQTINHWVGEQTHNLIKELLKPDDLNVDTRVVLTNAAYFKAGWSEPFAKERTKDEDFEVGPGHTQKVPMMHMSVNGGRFRFRKDGDYQVLELPYEDGRYSLLVILPTQKNGLADMEQTLTAPKLQALVSRLTNHLGDVAMPRFTVRIPCQLGNELTAMGMPLPFSRSADFSGISALKPLYIQKVVHQAVIIVDERGTEAAAATAVVVGTDSAPPYFSFRADHPFLYLITDRRTGTILFLGRMINPKHN